MKDLCPEVNPDTGQGCRLEPDHPLPHLPREPGAAPPAGAAAQVKAQARAAARRGSEQARLSDLDRSVRDGRNGRRVEHAPDGTYGTREKPVYRCRFGCEGPARQYMNARLCATHAPGATPENP